MHIFYLLRHAKSQPSDLPDKDWPLSKEGKTQAQDLLPKALKRLKLTHLVSSPYPRAIDTLSPFANEAGLNIEIDERLRERKLAEGQLDNWQEILKQSWEDFSLAMPHSESSAQCQQRVKTCIEEHLEATPKGTFVFSSHGNAIALYLNTIDPNFGFEQWKALKNPDLIVVNLKKNMYRSIAL